MAAEAAAAIAPPASVQPPNPARPAANPPARLVELKQKAALEALNAAEAQELADLEAVVIVPPKVETLQQKAEAMAREIRAQGYGFIDAHVWEDRVGDVLSASSSYEYQGIFNRGYKSYFAFSPPTSIEPSGLISDKTGFKYMKNQHKEFNRITINPGVKHRNDQVLVLHKSYDPSMIYVYYSFPVDYGDSRGDDVILRALVPTTIANQLMIEAEQNGSFPQELFKSLYPQLTTPEQERIMKKVPTAQLALIDERGANKQEKVIPLAQANLVTPKLSLQDTNKLTTRLQAIDSEKLLFSLTTVTALENIRRQYQQMESQWQVKPEILIPSMKEHYEERNPGKTVSVSYDQNAKKFSFIIGTEPPFDYSLDLAKNWVFDQIVDNEVYDQIYHGSASNPTIVIQSGAAGAQKQLMLDQCEAQLGRRVFAYNSYWEYALPNQLLPRAKDVAGRVYFNPYTQYAPEVMATVLKKIEEENRERQANGQPLLATQMKMMNRERLYPDQATFNPQAESFRPDKIVLYFEKDDIKPIFALVKKAYDEVNASHSGAVVFSPRRIPLMTGKIYDEHSQPLEGVSFAEEPPMVHASYGEILSTIFADLVREAPDGPITEEYLKDNLARYFVKHQIDVDTPYLFAPKVSVFQGKARDILKHRAKGIKVNINPGP